jgi:hypothetical protein
MLNSHLLLFGILFLSKDFGTPSLAFPEYLDKHDDYPVEDRRPLLFKQSINKAFVFQDPVKIARRGFVLTGNKQFTYSTTAVWTTYQIILTGFIFTVILYTLRFNGADEFGSSRTYPENCPYD